MSVTHLKLPSEGSCRHKGTRHAEFQAIASILKDWPSSVLQETDLYVTVEPCIMCASALRQYKIRAVYYGCANDRFGGTGGVFSIHSEYVVSRKDKGFYDNKKHSPNIDPPYPVYGGIFREEAIMLLRRFYIQENEKGEEHANSPMSIDELKLK